MVTPVLRGLTEFYTPLRSLNCAVIMHKFPGTGHFNLVVCFYIYYIYGFFLQDRYLNLTTLEILDICTDICTEVLSVIIYISVNVTRLWKQ